jgi:hypothetical protein
MLLFIHVLREDIRRGKRGIDSSCAVARACRREGLTDARVYNNYVRWCSDGVTVGVKFPPSAKDFIRRFDNPKVPKRVLKPFVFAIEIQSNGESL